MRIAVLKGLHVHICFYAPFKPGFIVLKKLVTAVCLSSIYSTSQGASEKTHQVLQGGKFWASQHIPQLNLDTNQEDPVKIEHADPEVKPEVQPEVQPEKKDTIQSNKEELKPEIPNNTQTDPLKIVHLDLKGAAPKVKYLKEVGINACKLNCFKHACMNSVLFKISLHVL